MDADFVVLDDGGLFSHCANAEQLLANFEYPDEAACIIDRAGNYRRLILDGDRALALGPVRGPGRRRGAKAAAWYVEVNPG